MSTKEAIKRAQRKYDMERTKSFHLKLHQVKDVDIIKALECCENKNSFIKNALREYLRIIH